MASIRIDQAEGLRRMIARPAPRVLTFLSATPDHEKSATLLNLGASLARTGSGVLLLDACATARGVGAGLDRMHGGTLLQAARAEARLADVVLPMPQGFGIAVMARGKTNAFEREHLSALFAKLSSDNDIVLVDAELDAANALPLEAMGEGDIVVQVEDSPESITAAYALIKRVSERYGRRPVSVLVTGAGIVRAGIIYRNIAAAARRYLALELQSIGSVPHDEHLARATRLGRTVIDAFPLAGASVAFRDLAGRFSRCAMQAGGRRSAPSCGATIGA
ncbi:MAG: MinD/ParA family protein [Burkholderiaceae bacterium]